jgi:hypothetical protein
MKQVLTAVILVSCCLGCSLKKEGSGRSEQSETEQALTAFGELKEALLRDKGALWDHRLDGPVMLVDRDTRLIIANEGDPEGFLSDQGRYFTGTLPDSIIIANTSEEWMGKRWTMVAFPLPETGDGSTAGSPHTGGP